MALLWQQESVRLWTRSLWFSCLPLPAPPPPPLHQLLEYITDVLAGVFLVAQASIVIYLAIALDNDNRVAQLGSRWGGG